MKVSIALSVGLFVLATALSAQQTISGTVQDSTGLSVPDAEIRVEQVGTGLTRTVRSGVTGDYAVTSLPVGPYKLQVVKEGFAAYVQTGIVLQVSSNPVVNIELQVGSVTQSVQVEAGAAMVETQNVGVGQVIDQQRVVDLPLNGRQIQQLIFLSGGSAPSPQLDMNNNKNYPVAAVFSVAGGTPAGVTYVLDGGTYNDPFNNLTLPLPFPDAIQEFKVETSAVPAQYGHHSTGAVSVATKSGTNQLHGDLFEFVRNYKFNARNFFALERDSLKRNQYGGTLGGPIRKNKLFFFGGYQGTVVKTNPASTISFTPTAAMRNGDFTEFSSASCQGTQRNLTSPYVGNKISPSAFSLPSVNLLKYVPVSTDPCGKYQYGIPNNIDEQMAIGKVDLQVSDKRTLLFRYTFAHYSNPPFFDGQNVLTTTKAGLNHRAQSFVIGDTYIWGPSLIFQTRFTVNRTHPTRIPAEFFTATDMGSKVYSRLPGYMTLSVTGGFSTAGQPVNPGYFNTTSFQGAEDVTYQHGSHQVAFGVNYIHSNLNSMYNVQTNGLFSFNGQLTGGNLGLADFMIGKMSSFVQGTTNNDDQRNHYIGLYIQDAWKVSRRLTINAGLRWDPYIPMHNRTIQVSHFEREWFTKGLHSTVFPNAPAGMFYATDPGLPGRSNNFGKLANFAPRLGVIWDPQGNGRTSLRFSYGIFYDLPGLQYAQKFAVAPPWGTTISLQNPIGGFADPWQDYPGGNPFPAKGALFPVAGVYVNMPLHMQPTYIQQFSVALQKQLGTNWLLSASYLGNRTIHLWGGTESNRALYIPGTCGTSACSTVANTNQRRVLYLENPAQGQYYSNFLMADDGGLGKYNGALVSIQHRLSNHFSVLANHTWAHCTQTPVIPELGGAGSAFLNPDDRRMDYGNCAWDLRHATNISLILESPKYSNKWLQRPLGDWRFSTIFVKRSGLWGSVGTGTDTSLMGNNSRPNLVLASPYTSDKTVDHWLNRAAFTSPGPGTYGNLGVQNILGPGSLNIDVSLSRQFNIREGQRVEFRGEAFNVPNHLNAGQPNSSLNSGLFGTINSASDPRIMQFALKYVF